MPQERNRDWIRKTAKGRLSGLFNHEPASNQVCNRCLSGILDEKQGDTLVVIEGEGRRRWLHCKTLREIKVSSEKCAVCYLLLREVLKAPDIDDGDLQNFCFVMDAVFSTFPYERHFEWNSGSLDLLIHTDGIGDRTEVEEELMSRAIWSKHEDISLDDRLPVVQEWCHDCEDLHPECRSHMRQEVLPTRLIKIAAQASRNPKLVETRSLDIIATTYTTLSYRWGDENQPLQTRQGNIESLKKSIPTSSLPKTFADAIDLTRKLGIRYIWIDALCIVQDSKEDWEREAAIMSDVYQGSYLNIAAIDSLDANGGCFLDTLIPSRTFTVKRAGGERPISIKFRTPMAKQEDVTDSTLLTRGW
jgi:hypothetical protein